VDVVLRLEGRHGLVSRGLDVVLAGGVVVEIMLIVVHLHLHFGGIFGEHHAGLQFYFLVQFIFPLDFFLHRDVVLFFLKFIDNFT